MWRGKLTECLSEHDDWINQIFRRHLATANQPLEHQRRARARRGAPEMWGAPRVQPRPAAMFISPSR